MLRIFTSDLKQLHRVGQKSIETRGNTLNIDCQVTLRRPIADTSPVMKHIAQSNCFLRANLPTYEYIS